MLFIFRISINDECANVERTNKKQSHETDAVQFRFFSSPFWICFRGHNNEVECQRRAYILIWFGSQIIQAQNVRTFFSSSSSCAAVPDCHRRKKMNETRDWWVSYAIKNTFVKFATHNRKSVVIFLIFRWCARGISIALSLARSLHLSLSAFLCSSLHFPLTVALALAWHIRVCVIIKQWIENCLLHTHCAFLINRKGCAFSSVFTLTMGFGFNISHMTANCHFGLWTFRRSEEDNAGKKSIQEKIKHINMHRWFRGIRVVCLCDTLYKVNAFVREKLGILYWNFQIVENGIGQSVFYRCALAWRRVNSAWKRKRSKQTVTGFCYR